MTKRTPLLVVLVLAVGCFGGQSGTPTPATPDPGCAETSRTALEDWEAPTRALSGVSGAWTGECGGQALQISIPTLDGMIGSAESVHYEWRAYGVEDAMPVECRTAYDVRFPASVSLSGDEASVDMAALHGRYLPTYDGVPAELDRYSSARTEMGGTLELDGDEMNAFSEPSGVMDAQITALSWMGVLSDDGLEFRGRIEWFGYDPNAEPPMSVPDDGSPGGTDPWNPGQGPGAFEPASVVSSCEFVLRRE